MRGWIRWSRAEAPGLLASYVQRGVVARLLPGELARELPGPAQGAALDRVRVIYEVFARCGIRYVAEDVGSRPGSQVIRTPALLSAG